MRMLLSLFAVAAMAVDSSTTTTTRPVYSDTCSDEVKTNCPCLRDAVSSTCRYQIVDGTTTFCACPVEKCSAQDVTTSTSLCTRESTTVTNSFYQCNNTYSSSSDGSNTLGSTSTQYVVVCKFVKRDTTGSGDTQTTTKAGSNDVKTTTRTPEGTKAPSETDPCVEAYTKARATCSQPPVCDLSCTCKCPEITTCDSTTDTTAQTNIKDECTTYTGSRCSYSCLPPVEECTDAKAQFAYDEAVRRCGTGNVIVSSTNKCEVKCGDSTGVLCDDARRAKLTDYWKALCKERNLLVVSVGCTFDCIKSDDATGDAKDTNGDGSVDSDACTDDMIKLYTAKAEERCGKDNFKCEGCACRCLSTGGSVSNEKCINCDDKADDCTLEAINKRYAASASTTGCKCVAVDSDTDKCKFIATCKCPTSEAADKQEFDLLADGSYQVSEVSEADAGSRLGCFLWQ